MTPSSTTGDNNVQDPLVYTNGQWCRQSEATVPFMDSGFWYGDGLFETLRVENGRVFRPYKHLARMQEGLQILHMEFPLPQERIVDLMHELVARNGFTQALLRLMVTRGTIPGTPWKYDGPANLYIGFRYPDPKPALPVKVIFVPEADFPLIRRHPAIKSMTYIGNMLATRHVAAQGAFEPVFVNREGLVTECAVRNIFFVKGHTLHTPDVSLGVLPGVTRDLILEMAADLGLNVDTGPIPMEVVNEMDEAFISSTGISIYPVTWNGFHPSDYTITHQLREAVETMVQKETGSS